MPLGIGIVRSLAFTKVATYCSQYNAVYNKLVELDDVPDTIQAYQQNLMVRNIASYVGWADWADVFYLFAQQYNDGGGALINLINPGTFDATLIGGTELTFTSLEGFSRSGINQYIRTHYNLSSDGINYSLNDAMTCCYLRTDAPSLDYLLGTSDGVNGSYILPYNGGGPSSLFGINDNASLTSIAGPVNKGFYLANRTASNAREAFINGISKGSDAQASTAIPDLEMYIMARNNSGSADQYLDGQVSAFGIGGSITGPQSLILTNAIEALMDFNDKGII